MQLVGVYLVFASLIVPALATHGLQHRRLAAGFAIGAAGCAAGLLLAAAGLAFAVVRSGVARHRPIC